MKAYFGVDIGGTDTKIGVFGEDAGLIEKWKFPTDLSDNGANIIPNIAAEVLKYRDRNKDLEIAGIGMGVPGPVDNTGFVHKCVDLNWFDFNPIEAVQKLIPGVCVKACNDANAAALGEYYYGIGKKYNSLMLVTLGTGVGGGVIIGGNIINGAHGLAGEIGHISVAPEEPEHCNCGNRGCIDQIASATGIVRIAERRLKESDRESSLRQYECLSAKAVCDEAAKGDVLAGEILDYCMSVLAKGLGYYTHAFDPEVYVIGGGVSNAGKLLTDRLQKFYESHLFLVDKAAVIEVSTLQNDAGIAGAFALVKENVNIL